MAHHLVRLSESIKKIVDVDDTIVFSKQLSRLSTDFVSSLTTDTMVREALLYLNECALIDEQLAINFAVVFTSKTFENLSLCGHNNKMRSEVLQILQSNFMKHAELKRADVTKFYNSITLLGEFYNRLKINNGPIQILGQSLLELLEKELYLVLDSKMRVSPEFAKLLLTQITLNGVLFKAHHEKQLHLVFDSIRRCLIEVRGCSVKAKAFLLMTLDLYYSNFNSNVIQTMQNVYGSYLLIRDQESAEEAAADDSPSIKRQKVETVDQMVQTEVASYDVFRAGPAILPPNKSLSTATLSTASLAPQVVPHSPRSDTAEIISSQRTPSISSSLNSSSPSKSRIDQRIRNVRIGRVYPSPVKRSPHAHDSSSEDEVAKLSRANVMAHTLATMKENQSNANRIRNGFLDRISPPYETISARNEGGNLKGMPAGTKKSASSTGTSSVRNTKYLMEENTENLTFDPAYFEEDFVPANANPHSKSFLQFLENRQ